jgi:putative ABC transport system permease protein
MAILRSVGARPGHVFGLMVLESGLLALLGVLLGLALTYAALAGLAPLLEHRFGVFVELSAPSAYDVGLLGLVVGAGLLIGAVPAWRAYRNSLADGLTIRV